MDADVPSRKRQHSETTHCSTSVPIVADHSSTSPAVHRQELIEVLLGLRATIDALEVQVVDEEEEFEHVCTPDADSVPLQLTLSQAHHDAGNVHTELGNTTQALAEYEASVRRWRGNTAAG